MSYMNFIMIGLLLREALDRLRVRLNMCLVRNLTNIKYHYLKHMTIGWPVWLEK